jgi:aconitase A
MGVAVLAAFAKGEGDAAVYANRVMEFGGPGLASLSPDEHATLANMATECAARSGIVEP